MMTKEPENAKREMERFAEMNSETLRAYAYRIDKSKRAYEINQKLNELTDIYMRIMGFVK